MHGKGESWLSSSTSARSSEKFSETFINIRRHGRRRYFSITFQFAFQLCRYSLLLRSRSSVSVDSQKSLPRSEWKASLYKSLNHTRRRRDTFWGRHEVMRAFLISVATGDLIYFCDMNVKCSFIHSSPPRVDANDFLSRENVKMIKTSRKRLTMLHLMSLRVQSWCSVLSLPLRLPALMHQQWTATVKSTETPLWGELKTLWTLKFHCESFRKQIFSHNHAQQ